MEWREAKESEKTYLKKKYIRQAAVMGTMCAVSVALAIYLLVRILGVVSGDGDRSYLAFAIFLLAVNLVFIGWMVFGPIAEEVRRYRLVKRGKILVAECVADEIGQEFLVVDFLSDKPMKRERIDRRL